MENLITIYEGMLKKLLNSNVYNFSENLSKSLPKKGGVYRIFEQNTQEEESFYIGKTGNIKRRINFHYKGDISSSTLKIKLLRNKTNFSDKKDVMNYLSDNCSVQFLLIKDDRLRTWFEHFAIAILMPKWND